MIKTSIYDFFDKGKYYYYEAESLSKHKLKDEIILDSILVNAPSKANDLQIKTNLKPYLIDHTNPSDLDYKREDFTIEKANIIYSKESNTAFNRNPKYSKERIVYSWNIFNALSNLEKLKEKDYLNKDLKYNIHKYKQSLKNLAQDLENFFFYQKGLIHEKNNKYENQIVIPVYDNISVDSQELLLSKFKNRNKTSLLWRSISTYLGVENEISKYDLKDNDEIVIVDRHNNNLLFTKLLLVYNDKEHRLIPVHKSFRDSYNHSNGEYYGTQMNKFDNIKFNSYIETLYYPQKGKFPEQTNDGWKLTEINEINKNLHVNKLPFEDTSQIKLVILTDKNIFYNYSRIPSHYGNSNTIAKGASVFSQLKSVGKIPYYDHCEALHIVYQKGSEDMNTVEYFTLIEENDRAEGGKIIHGKINSDLSIDKGNNYAQFLFRIGNKDDKAPLKVNKQYFNITELLSKWQLTLKPTMSPGQGRAQIIISCKNNVYNTSKTNKPFDEVQLDWDNLEDSNDTVASLREKLPKAFPPPINMVNSYSTDYNNSVLRENIIRFNNGQKVWGFEINKTKWPYRDENSIKRFQRTNYFGNEDGHRYPNLGVNSKEIIHEFLTNLANNPIANLKTIAWTYQGRSQEYFNRIIDQTLNHVLNLELSAVEASLLINLLEDEPDDDLIVVFKACLKKFRRSNSGFNNWMRCLYQLLMYHEFISSEKITNDECISMMKCLIDIHKDAEDKGKPIISNNALRSMLFLLKRRKVFPGFCKKDAKDGLYYNITALLPSFERDPNYPLIVTIIGFLDGYGSIEGIPLD
jgi:hypothetical protein